MTDNQKYWEKIPIWNGDNPEDSFIVVKDEQEEFSERIPVTKIEHWNVFKEILESSFFKNPVGELVFRGHRRYDWGLTSSFGRLFDNEIITGELADKQLEIFRKAIRGRINDHSLLEVGGEDDELWSIGQHHGLMTPLLDWTYSPYVALFFAFEKEDQNEEKDNPYRAVYVLNKSFVIDNDESGEIRVFEPKKDDHGRLVSQAGLFIFSPYGATIENKIIEALGDSELNSATEDDEEFILAKYVCKIYIKNEGQKECLNYLWRMNVHHASLFPDIIGSSMYSNKLIEKQINSLKSEPKTVGSKTSINKLPIIDSEVIEAITNINGLAIIDQKGESEDNIKALNQISDLLNQPKESSNIDSEIISLIAKKLLNVLDKGKLVDWKDRESLQAEMKTKTHIILRKHGYPIEARESIVDNILKVDPDFDDDEK